MYDFHDVDFRSPFVLVHKYLLKNGRGFKFPSVQKYYGVAVELFPKVAGRRYRFTSRRIANVAFIHDGFKLDNFVGHGFCRHLLWRHVFVQQSFERRRSRDDSSVRNFEFSCCANF